MILKTSVLATDLNHKNFQFPFIKNGNFQLFVRNFCNQFNYNNLFVYKNSIQGSFNSKDWDMTGNFNNNNLCE